MPEGVTEKVRAALLSIIILSAGAWTGSVLGRHHVGQSKETGTVADVEGHTYPTVKIGEQWWMAANLNTETAADGTHVTGYCYEHDPSSCEAYGRLFTWSSAMNGSTEEGAQGLCPDGWHLPSDHDWTILFDHLGGIDVAGGAMKATGTSLWLPPNQGATNSSGFNGLPAGSYAPQRDNFEGQGVGGHFWSSTQQGSNAGLPTLHKDEVGVTPLVVPKDVTGSVRCVKDGDVPVGPTELPSSPDTDRPTGR